MAIGRERGSKIRNYDNNNVVATFTPIGVAISRMLGLRTACYWLSAWQQAGAVHHGTGTTAIVNVRRFVIKSLLFTCKWVGWGWG